MHICLHVFVFICACKYVSIYVQNVYMVDMYIDLCAAMCMNIVCMLSYIYMIVYMYV